VPVSAVAAMIQPVRVTMEIALAAVLMIIPAVFPDLRIVGGLDMEVWHLVPTMAVPNQRTDPKTRGRIQQQPVGEFGSAEGSYPPPPQLAKRLHVDLHRTRADCCASPELLSDGSR